MRMLRFFAVAMAVLTGLPTVSIAAEPVTTPLPRIQHADIALAVIATDGSVTRYSPDELEELPVHTVTTTTPWRTEPAVFTGVLLRDLLAAHGLDTLDSVIVSAENDYEVPVRRAVWQQTDMLVATRVNGAAIPRRQRGPLLFVLDAEAYAANSDVTESHLVWMVARIGPPD